MAGAGNAAGAATVRPSAQSVRWFSTMLSLVVLGLFVGVFFLRYQALKQDAEQRDMRLLGVASEALRQSTAGDVEGTRVLTLLEHPACPRGIGVVVDKGGAGGLGSGAEAKLTFCLDFRRVLDFIPRRSTSFDKVLLAAEPDRILEQSAETAVPHLSSFRILRLIGADGQQTDKSPRLSDMPPQALVQAGERRFHLFCQQAISARALPGVEAKAGESALSLCGLVSEERMRSEALWVPPLLLVLLCALLAFALLFPPFLKVNLLSPTERLRFADAFAISVCIFFGLTLAWLVGQGIYLYERVTDEADRRLEHVASVIARDLTDELTRAKAQLSAFDGKLEPPPSPAGEPGAAVEPENAEPAEVLLRKPKADEWSEYPEAEAVAWVDGTGRQRMKVTTQESPQLLNVASRDYFRRAMKATRGTSLLDFVRTWANGETRALVVHREASGRGVLVLSTPLPSLARAVLPAGSSFALVNRAGDVLFHSDPSLSKSHNLLVESNRDRELGARLEQSRGGAISRVSYWGKDHRAFVRPIAGENGVARELSLVVFEESDPLRMLVFGALLNALAYSALYSLLWIGIAAFYIAVTRRQIEWSWPRDELRRTYWWVGGWFLVLAGVFLVLPPLWAYALPFAMGISVVVWLALRPLARKKRRAEAPRLGQSHWRAYSFAASVFWVVSAITPAHQFANFAEADARADFAAARRPPALLPSGDLTEQSLARRQAARDELARASAFLPARQLGAPDASLLVPFLLLTAAFGAVLYMVLWGARSLFLWGVEAPGDPRAGPGDERRDLFCVTSSRRTLPRSDLLTTGGDRPVIQALLEPRDFDTRTLAFLEARKAAGGRTIVLALANPVEVLTSLAAERDGATVARWTALFSDFRVTYLRDERIPRGNLRVLAFATKLFAVPGRGAVAPFARCDIRWVTRELRANEHVFEACRRNLERGALAEVEGRELRRRLRDAAAGYYLELWESCSLIEKLTLFQLTEEGFINEKQVEVVRHLLGRGLIRRRPMLAPLNEGFASFIRDAGSAANLKAYEAPPEGMTWLHLRAPLFTLLFCTAFALFATQRALFDSTLIFATALTGVLPHLARLAALAGVGVGAQRLVQGAAATGSVAG